MENIGRLEKIDVVRKEGNEIHVLGKLESYLLNFSDYNIHIIYDTKNNVVKEKPIEFTYGILSSLIITFATVGVALPVLIRSLKKGAREKIKEYDNYIQLVEDFKYKNMEDLKEAVKDIKVYQGSVNDISMRLGKEIKHVSTEKSEEFIRASDTFWLRVKAHDLGANAVINYQPGSSVGTPVIIKN